MLFVPLRDSFQSTLSMRRATDGSLSQPAIRSISIHALHEESDVVMVAIWSTRAPFQSTLSMRRATNSYALYVVGTVISIHALHEESDNTVNVSRYENGYFNPRSP